MAKEIKKKAQTLAETSTTWDQEKIKLVKNIAAKDATDTEFQLLFHIANKYDLDPLMKEIWCIKRNASSPAIIMTSRDGYLKIAHRSGQFDGLHSGYDKEQGIAWCEVWRKDMNHSFKAEITASEYKQNSPVWSQYPSAMAIKVAEVFALKRAFSISGMTTEDEISSHESEEVPQMQQAQPQKVDATLDKLRKKIFAMGNELGLDGDTTKESSKKIYGAEHFNDLTKEQLEGIVDRLQKKLDEKVLLEKKKAEKIQSIDAQSEALADEFLEEVGE